jgi:rare lipoprotein A
VAVVTTPIAPVSTAVPAAVAATGAAPDPSPAQAPAPAPEVAPMRNGYSVQLGAFANYANAQAFLAHAQNQLASARVEARIRQSGGLYRVYVGPYSTRSEAERLSARITQAFGFPTTIAAH